MKPNGRNRFTEPVRRGGGGGGGPRWNGRAWGRKTRRGEGDEGRWVCEREAKGRQLVVEPPHLST